MQFAVASVGHMVEIFRFDTGKVECIVHRGALESEFAKFQKLPLTAPEPLVLEPIARKTLVARQIWKRHLGLDEVDQVNTLEKYLIMLVTLKIMKCCMLRLETI